MFDKIVAHVVTSVSELPDTCSYKRELETMVANPNDARVVAVVVGGTMNKRALIGYPAETYIRQELKKSDDVMYHVKNIHHPDQVGRLGNVLDRETAKQLFPSHFG